MIPRRIAEHVKSHNWFAVAIDFLIVVMGVFIGMQVQEWNAARQAHERAAIYGARLLEDMRFEAWQFEYLIAYYKDVLTNAERAVAALTDGPPLSDEQLIVSAYRASQYLFYGTRRATYDEMVATGDIGLIADQHLRETALTFYADPTIEVITDEGKNSEYRKRFRSAVPADVQRTLLKDCGDHIVEPGDFANIVGSINYECTLDLPPEKITVAAARLRADPQLVSALQLRFADIETAILNLEQGTPGLLDNLRALNGASAP